VVVRLTARVDPGLHLPALEPEVVFFVFLSPILWSAAFFTPVREILLNSRTSTHPHTAATPNLPQFSVQRVCGSAAVPFCDESRCRC